MSVDGPHVSAAWLTVNNIFSVMDIRLDFLGARLSNGTMLKSSLATQSRSGSAATFSLVNTVLPGLSFSLAAGIAGGIAQKPENYDTIALDYYPGMPSEFGVQAKAGWNQYFTPLNSDLTASLEFIMPDLLVEMTNFAGGASLGWNTVGFISVNTLFEAQVVSWADRLVEGDKPELSMAFANKTSARVFGVSPEIQVQWKSAGFSSRNKNRVENRYAGITAKDDFDSVHLNSAFLLKAGFDFNPAYFLYKDIVNLHVEAEGFLVDFDLYGLGWNGKVDVDLYDFTRIPLQLDGSVSYYKNEKLPVFADMNNLPERMFIDYLTWSAGLTFKPIKDITFMLNYNSKPSVSRRQSIRESSILFSTKITF
ncbi:MAG: hypothetical protein GX241_06535 [Ruminococcaceae bacterium]|nr:hypothetical protein [Oscillospiraceae bacterium]